MHPIHPLQRARAGQVLPRGRGTPARLRLLALAALSLGAAGCASPERGAGGGDAPSPAHGEGQTGGDVQDAHQQPLPPELEPFRPLLGQTLAAAERWLAANPTSVRGTRITRVRPVVRDGEELIVTMDYREDRLNVAVRGDVIVGLKSIG